MTEQKVEDRMPKTGLVPLQSFGVGVFGDDARARVEKNFFDFISELARRSFHVHTNGL